MDAGSALLIMTLGAERALPWSSAPTIRPPSTRSPRSSPRISTPNSLSSDGSGPSRIVRDGPEPFVLGGECWDTRNSASSPAIDAGTRTRMTVPCASWSVEHLAVAVDARDHVAAAERHRDRHLNVAARDLGADSVEQLGEPPRSAPRRTSRRRACHAVRYAGSRRSRRSC